MRYITWLPRAMSGYPLRQLNNCKATGEQISVREFVELAAGELGGNRKLN